MLFYYVIFLLDSVRRRFPNATEKEIAVQIGKYLAECGSKPDRQLQDECSNEGN